ncbi:NUDIX hydrolase [Actinomadura sp. WMMA1423]|uniref:NUDIX hydrolase n=1 Tax=Actinomadura sp. WMMA1423 TaxID=2591108 RepID=UPI0011476EB3|nr:NUDIX hydrolase [Actinomadura sp. WMMA1423]
MHGRRTPLAKDRQGNALTDFLPATLTLPGDAPMPAALAAVWHDHHLLLVYDRRRRQWELPGGRIEPGESPLDAAVRELHEETGLHLPALTLAGHARFQLVSPPRDEYAALFTGESPARHTAFTPTPEIAAIRWWSPTTPRPRDAQPLDTALALMTPPGRPPDGAGQWGDG